MVHNLDLIRLFKGFVRNYGTLLLGKASTRTYTHREIGFWMRLGEMMGYFTRMEEQRVIYGEKRLADLLWLDDDGATPVLHLEVENTMPGDELVDSRLDPSVPYLVAIFWGDQESDNRAWAAAEKLIRRSDQVRQILLIIWHPIEGQEDILVNGVRFARRSDRTHIVRHIVGGRLRRIEKHTAGLYYGVLDEDWEDLWSCDFCHTTFLSKKEVVKHEKTCSERPGDE